MSHVRIPYDTFQKTAPGPRPRCSPWARHRESGLDKTIVELAKLRVSQINNCAFCLQIHLNVSRRLGVPQEKLDLVATWHEAGIFSEQECAALAWAETADPARRSQRARRGLCGRVPAFQPGRGDRAQRGDRQHQCLEPAGCRLPLRAADPEEGGDGGIGGITRESHADHTSGIAITCCGNAGRAAIAANQRSTLLKAGRSGTRSR